MTDAEYRRTPVKLRARIRIIKNHLRRKDYAFVTSAQLSKANKYRAAFMRNSAERCAAFMKQVKKGETSAQHWGVLSRTVIPVLSIVSVPRRLLSRSKISQIMACDFHATDELHGDRPPF